MFPISFLTISQYARYTFPYSKARYRGITKNAARIWALPASAN